MFRRHLVALAGLSTAAAVVFTLLCSRSDPRSPGPQNLEDVAQIAGELGLYQRSDDLSGKVTHRLVVSDLPLTFERASELRFGDPAHPCWRGTVEACIPWKMYQSFADPEYGVVWGEIFLFGDPALIRTLLAHRPQN
jgi:hypothetical protein